MARSVYITIYMAKSLCDSDIYIYIDIRRLYLRTLMLNCWISIQWSQQISFEIYCNSISASAIE